MKEICSVLLRSGVPGPCLGVRQRAGRQHSSGRPSLYLVCVYHCIVFSPAKDTLTESQPSRHPPRSLTHRLQGKIKIKI